MWLCSSVCQTAGGGEGGTPTALGSDDQFCLILTFASIKLATFFHPNSVGRFKFRGRLWTADGAFARDSIGLSPTDEDGLWMVSYCHFSIGLLDINTESNRLKPIPPPETLENKTTTK